MQRNGAADIAAVIITKHIHGDCFVAVFSQQGGIRMGDCRMPQGPRFYIENDGAAFFFQIRVYRLDEVFLTWQVHARGTDPVWLRLVLSRLE